MAIHFAKHCCPHLNSSSCQCVLAAALCTVQYVPILAHVHTDTTTNSVHYMAIGNSSLAIHFAKHCCHHQLLNSSSCQCVMAAAFCILQEVWCAFKQLLLPTTFIADCSVARRTCCRTAIQINERHPLPMPLSLCYSVFWPSYHLVTQLQQSRS